MTNGIKVSNGIITCARCGQKVSKDGELKLNYCPKCGNPLNIKANVETEKMINHEKLVMLYEIKDQLEEQNADQLIDDYIKQLIETNQM